LKYYELKLLTHRQFWDTFISI